MDGRGHAGAQVHQGADQRGGAHVVGDPEAIRRGVARLHGDQALAREYRRHLEVRTAQHRGHGTQHDDLGGHVVAFARQRLAQPLDIASLVVERRRLQLEVHLADVGVEDDQATEAHRRRLRHAQQLGDLAGHVLVNVRLA